MINTGGVHLIESERSITLQNQFNVQTTSIFFAELADNYHVCHVTRCPVLVARLFMEYARILLPYEDIHNYIKRQKQPGVTSVLVYAEHLNRKTPSPTHILNPHS